MPTRATARTSGTRWPGTACATPTCSSPRPWRSASSTARASSASSATRSTTCTASGRRCPGRRTAPGPSPPCPRATTRPTAGRCPWATPPCWPCARISTARPASCSSTPARAANASSAAREASRPAPMRATAACGGPSTGARCSSNSGSIRSSATSTWPTASPAPSTEYAPRSTPRSWRPRHWRGSNMRPTDATRWWCATTPASGACPCPWGANSTV